ncbi:MAG: hypothetical protein KAT65_04895 [Methanophagales archaeon]|nr:hypothetical protein [Methanophagales archaeon]
MKGYNDNCCDILTLRLNRVNVTFVEYGMANDIKNRKNDKIIPEAF